MRNRASFLAALVVLFATTAIFLAKSGFSGSEPTGRSPGPDVVTRSETKFTSEHQQARATLGDPASRPRTMEQSPDNSSAQRPPVVSVPTRPVTAHKKGKLKGTIVWQEGKMPAAAITVECFAASPAIERALADWPAAAAGIPSIGRAKSDSEGRFEVLIPSLPGELFLSIRVSQRQATVFKLAEMPRPGESFELGELSIKMAGRLTGQILDSHGNPLARAWVRVQPEAAGPMLDFEPDGLLLSSGKDKYVFPIPKSARDEITAPGSVLTDDQGFFDLASPDRTASKLRVQASDHRPLTRNLDLAQDGSLSLGAVQLDEGAKLTGIVVDRLGLPVADVRLSAGSSGRNMETENFSFHVMSKPVITGPDGKFEISGLVPGDYFLLWKLADSSTWRLHAGPVEPGLSCRINIDVYAQIVQGPPQR